jgi:hypothetical protein
MFAGLAVNCTDYPRLIRDHDDFTATTLLARALAPTPAAPARPGRH